MRLYWKLDEKNWVSVDENDEFSWGSLFYGMLVMVICAIGIMGCLGILYLLLCLIG